MEGFNIFMKVCKLANVIFAAFACFAIGCLVRSDTPVT